MLQRPEGKPLELELWVFVIHVIWVLGSELPPRALHCSAISLPVLLLPEQGGAVRASMTPPEAQYLSLCPKREQAHV